MSAACRRALRPKLFPQRPLYLVKTSARAGAASVSDHDNARPATRLCSLAAPPPRMLERAKFPSEHRALHLLPCTALSAILDPDAALFSTAQTQFFCFRGADAAPHLSTTWANSRCRHQPISGSTSRDRCGIPARCRRSMNLPLSSSSFNLSWLPTSSSPRPSPPTTQS